MKPAEFIDEQWIGVSQPRDQPTSHGIELIDSLLTR